VKRKYLRSNTYAASRKATGMCFTCACLAAFCDARNRCRDELSTKRNPQMQACVCLGVSVWSYVHDGTRVYRSTNKIRHTLSQSTYVCDSLRVSCAGRMRFCSMHKSCKPQNAVIARFFELTGCPFVLNLH